MPNRTGFFAKSFSQTIVAIEHMASPRGTTIGELTKILSLTRRSVFRLLRTIERFNIPVTVKREHFGGTASYHLPIAFIKKISSVNIPPVSLRFNQAVLVYLILNDDIFSNDETAVRLLQCFLPDNHSGITK